MPAKRVAATRASSSTKSAPPIKRTESSSSRKRKASSSDSEEPEAEASQSQSKSKKKAKVASTSEEGGAEDGGLSANGQPTNKVLPVNINFAPKHADSIRISSWNICGLGASSKKGFKSYVEAEDADILILTETKVNDPPLSPELTQRYAHRYWSISDKKTYSGTAILSKINPISVDYTLPGHPDPKFVKGRIVTVEFDNTYVIGTYVVNAGAGLKTLDAKEEWNKHFEAYIRTLNKKKAVIWAGDLNVAPTALDLANPKPNWNKTAGYTAAETSSFARILDPPESSDNEKMIDIWRHLHPDLRHYTYFSYRFNCRMKGIGWRLDHFVLSKRIVDKVKMCEIRSEIYGASDHCPLVLEITNDI